GAVGAAVDLADDDVLGDVHQTPGEVPGVGGAQRRVRQTLALTVGGDEVLQHRQALAVGRLDRTRDRLTLGVGHQSADTGDLADLHGVTAGTGVDHHPHRVVGGRVLLHVPGDLVGGLGPDVGQVLAALLVADQTALVLALDLLGFLLVGVEDLVLGRRRDHVADADGQTRAGGPVVPGVLEG